MLELDLIPHLRQLFVRANLVARDRREDFFVRHTENHVSAFAIFQTKHLVADRVPATRFLPELRRMKCRQEEFLTADRVHRSEERRVGKEWSSDVCSSDLDLSDETSRRRSRTSDPIPARSPPDEVPAGRIPDRRSRSSLRAGSASLSLRRVGPAVKTSKFRPTTAGSTRHGGVAYAKQRRHQPGLRGELG